jgi:hypothetical protein
MSLEFTYDDGAHAYARLDGRPIPHITGMLERAGEIDDRWYTEESSARGTHVHKLTADFDLGALEPARCQSRFKGYLLGHVAAVGILRPEFKQIEEPMAHPTYHFAGRPDRIALIYMLLSILELKSGGKEKSHQIQTALQAILAAARYGIPAEAIPRYCLYLQDNGRYKLERHDKQKDFVRAYEIIRQCC